MFATIRPVLAELVREAPRADSSFLHAEYPVDRQVAFYENILATSASRRARTGSTRP